MLAKEGFSYSAWCVYITDSFCFRAKCIWGKMIADVQYSCSTINCRNADSAAAIRVYRTVSIASTKPAIILNILQRYTQIYCTYDNGLGTQLIITEPAVYKKVFGRRNCCYYNYLQKLKRHLL